MRSLLFWFVNLCTLRYDAFCSELWLSALWDVMLCILRCDAFNSEMWRLVLCFRCFARRMATTSLIVSFGPSFCPSICPHRTMKLPQGGYWWHFLLWIFTKICHHISILVNSGQEEQVFYIESDVCVTGLCERDRRFSLWGIKSLRNNCRNKHLTFYETGK